MFTNSVRLTGNSKVIHLVEEHPIGNVLKKVGAAANIRRAAGCHGSFMQNGDEARKVENKHWKENVNPILPILSKLAESLRFLSTPANCSEFGFMAVNRMAGV